MKPYFNGFDRDGTSWILRFLTILGIVGERKRERERERERGDVWESQTDQVEDRFTIFFESLIASLLLHGFSRVWDFVYKIGTGLESC